MNEGFLVSLHYVMAKKRINVFILGYSRGSGSDQTHVYHSLHIKASWNSQIFIPSRKVPVLVDQPILWQQRVLLSVWWRHSTSWLESWLETAEELRNTSWKPNAGHSSNITLSVFDSPCSLKKTLTNANVSTSICCKVILWLQPTKAYFGQQVK